MTIYTSRPEDDNKKNSEVPYPEVVTDPLIPPYYSCVIGPEKKIIGGGDDDDFPVAPAVVTISTRKRRSNFANFCALLTVLVVLAVGIIGGIYLYKHLAHRTFRGWCKVQYYEYQDTADDSRDGAHRTFGHSQHRRQHVGHFEEKVEIDKTDGKYERIEVPAFDEVKRATILHDFERNLTAIVDRDNYRCFVMNLNRTVVKPPKDFWDLLNKLGSGYYMPDVEVVRERYSVIQPPMPDKQPLGYYIWRECRRFDTYRLQKVQQNGPVAMVKRSAKQHEFFANPGNFLEIMELDFAEKVHEDQQK